LDKLPKTADVVIIGGGIMGLFIAYYLAKRDCHKIAVLESQDYLGGVTTNLCAGGLRYQFSNRINIELSKKSLDILANFEAEFGLGLEINKCGYLFALTNEYLDHFRQACNLQNSLGVKTEWLTREAVEQKIPFMNLDDIVAGTFCGEDGLVDPHRVTSGVLKALREKNVALFPGNPALEIGVEKNRITAVKTPNGTVNTPIVVNAAGPWISLLARLAGVELPVFPALQQLFVTGKVPGVPAGFPVVIFPKPGLGFHREGEGILTGMTMPLTPAKDFSMNVDQAWEAKHCENAINRLPGLANAELKSSWAGLYAETPDECPILGKIPWLDGFYCAGGFSGHGFMHAPVCGLLLSEEIIDGKAATMDIRPLRVDRYINKVAKAEVLKI
jgi:sarcosine oxidase subunit beta